jgi:leader peptidase (prepilin peptidase)/N-methyltransferase
MNIILNIVFGFVGGFAGFFIPYFSYKIMEYKRRKKNIINGKDYMKSKFIRLVFALFNSVAWLLCIINIDNSISAVLISMQITLGIIIAFIDINIRIIPNELVLAVLITGILFQSLLYGTYGIIGSIMSMIFIMIVFTAVAIFMGLGKVGAGDVKLAGAIGFALGYPLVITAMVVMSFVLIGFILSGLVFKKIKLTTMLPLAPFLATGYISALVSLAF